MFSEEYLFRCVLYIIYILHTLGAYRHKFIFRNNNLKETYPQGGTCFPFYTFFTNTHNFFIEKIFDISRIQRKHSAFYVCAVYTHIFKIFHYIRQTKDDKNSETQPTNHSQPPFHLQTVNLSSCRTTWKLCPKPRISPYNDTGGTRTR